MTTAARTMRVTRLYTGPDLQSHFEDFDVPLDERGAIGCLSARHTVGGSSSATPTATTTTRGTTRRSASTS